MRCLGKYLGPRDEVTGEWRKLHSAELHALYSSPDIRNSKCRSLRWAGHIVHIDEFRNAYRVLVGRPEGKRSLGRPNRRWEDNIKMDLREMGYDDRDWIKLAQDRHRCRAFVRTGMNLRVLKKVISNSDLALSEYHLFGPVKEQPRGQRYETLEDIRKAVRQCLRTAGTDFDHVVVFKLTERSLQSKETLRGHSESSFRGEGYIQCCVGVRLCDMYSNQELAEIHFMYGKADGNAALARRLYQERYPQRQCPQIGRHLLTGQAYTNVLENTIPHVLEDTPLMNRQHIHFLHDGAPAHFSRTARRYLDRRFPDRWIGRGGPIAWPPRSPDLNPLDFYLWGHLKSLVYLSPVPDLESLRNRIVACSEDIRNTPGVWDRVLRAKRDEVTGERRKLHNTELHALYSSPDIIRNIKSRRLRWAEHVVRMGESRNTYIVLVGRPEGERLLERPRRRWEDNIKMDLRFDDRDWINLAQHYLQIRTTRSQFTVLLSQSLEFTVSRTTDLQRQFTVLELGSLQLRSTALELRSLQLRSTALELSDADADADAHSSRTPVHKTGLLALAFSLTG
ncbi:hypothetical protein ANN_04814 [Periplaneta americana]|uniref:Uncharacterized protein n=1 Tax=Periplaneta americana TaxID=6978 RepID=A0ABQ8TB23_PERAM|nr:hypothetical protein ANN_04814 [Periplaneta americana]